MVVNSSPVAVTPSNELNNIGYSKLLIIIVLDHPILDHPRA